MSKLPSWAKIHNKWFRGANCIHTKLVKVTSIDWVWNSSQTINKYESIAHAVDTDGNEKVIRVSELMSRRWTVIGTDASLARQLKEQKEKLEKGKELLRRQGNDNHWRERIIEQIEKVT